MKKKILSTVLALTMAISMTACGGSEPETNAGDVAANASNEVSENNSDNNAQAAEADSTVTEAVPEEPEEPALPELPEGYERYSLIDETFGVEVSFL